MKEIELFNIIINPLSRAEFVSLINTQIKSEKQVFQVGINSATINEIVINKEFKEAINRADLKHIDGMSVVWALRFLGYKIPERVATPDLAEEIMKMAENENYSIFLFGARDEMLTACISNIKMYYPSLKIAGYRNGYFKPEDEDSIVKTINEAAPDILFLGMSSPVKELFCERHRNELKVKYLLGVGGYFDILSGYIKRAPRWMQNIGLEWSYRLLQEPKRMWRRYLIGNNKFLWLIIKEKFKRH